MSLDVTVQYCGRQSFVAGSDTVTLDGVRQPQFTISSTVAGSIGNYSCRYLATSTGTITLPGDGQPHDLQAKIRDGRDSVGTWVESYTYTYVPPPSYAVTVYPVTATAQHPGGTAAAEAFIISNTGNVADSFTVTVGCTGAASVCRSTAKVRVGPASFASVPVSYRLAATGTGTVSLTATSAHASGSGSLAVSVTAAAFPSTGYAADAGDQTTAERSLCVKLPAGKDAAYECGDLRIAHALPATTVLNQMRQPVLIYSARQASPRGLVGKVVTPQNDLQNVTLRLQLTGGAAYTRSFFVAGSPGFAPWPAGSTRRLAIDFDASALATGVYAYTLTVTADRVGGPTNVTVASDSGKLAVVNRGASALGPGWWVAGVEQLVPLASGDMLWIGGDGSTRVYRAVDATHWAGPALARPDTLLRDTIVVSGASQTAYVRLLPGRTKVIFDATGHHLQTRNSIGHITRFDWSGDRLTAIRLPYVPGVFDTGLQYTFEYNNNGGTRLSRIVAPGTAPARVLTVTTDGTARLTQIAGPDTTRVGFGYTGTLLTSSTDRRGTISTYTYGDGGLLTDANLPLNASEQAHYGFSAQEAQGMSAAVALAQLRTVYTDPRGAKTEFFVNRLGAPDSLRNALGHVTRLSRADPRWPALATRSVATNGREQAAAYDTRGRVTSNVDLSTGAATFVQWNDTWDRPSRVSQPEGEFTTTAYDYLGRVEWIQVGADTARRARFDYFAPTEPLAPGMIAIQTMPLNRHEWYNYGGLGNITRTQYAFGLESLASKDAVGRVYYARSTTGAQTWLTYDAADEVVEEHRVGPARTVSTLRGDTTYAEEHLWVHTYRNAEGQPDSVARWQSPDPNALGRIVTGFRYDRAGRKTVEVAMDSTPATLADNPRDSTVYDLAGNPTRMLTRRGLAIDMRYDTTGRLLERITPASTAPGRTTDLGSFYNPRLFIFPFFFEDAEGNFTGAQMSAAQPVTIPADTARFTYDEMGNVLTANNRSAQVTRTWNSNGTLASETQRIRTYAGQNWSAHAYTLGYQYDLDGRRTQLTHPGNISPSAPVSSVTRYGYDPDTGDLASVSGLSGYTFERDASGEVTRLRRGTGVVEDFGYDDLGRLAHRTEMSGNLQVHDDWFDFDPATSEVRGVNALREVVKQARRGLGALSYVTTFDVIKGTRRAEYYGTDPLTNQVYNRVDAFKADQPTTQPDVQEDPLFIYEHNTGRLTATAGVGAPSHIYEFSIYDAAGNQIFRSGLKPVSTPYSGYTSSGGYTTNVGATLRDESAFYYGADDRLYVADRRSCLYFNSPDLPPNTVSCDPQRPPAYQNRSAFEEYRYDALGRRVLVRTRSEFACTQYCLNTLRRQIWDGDQLLYEISAPGGSSATSAQMEADTGLAVPFFQNQTHTAVAGFFPYGRVMYEHGAGIDAPLGVVRMEYSSELRDPQVIVPHSDWRGSYDRGTTVFGSCVVYSSNGTMLTPPPDSTPANSEQYGGVAGGGMYSGTKEHCIDVDWPASYTYSALQYRRGYAGPDAWMGSLIFDQRDASGLYYRRNRFYDSDKGRFTQEDPIGLAGGVNVYGFAAGDPVGYDDPSGLCPWCVAAEIVRGAAEGAVFGAATQIIVNRIAHRPTFQGVGRSAAEGAAIGSVTAGIGSAVRGVAAIRSARAAAAARGGVIGYEAASSGFRVLESEGSHIIGAFDVANGEARIITEVVREGDNLILRGSHIEGDATWREVTEAARSFGREQGVRTVTIEGGARTTGARPGHIPRPIVIQTGL
ncbi:MAG TPA: RHS repeat-associated core domain-containing protein [Longimicrobiaceae bacterium]|nr:RHS repeat-associated core domain-containing protein [Longimicrobiaceae bacterium]